VVVVVTDLVLFRWWWQIWFCFGGGGDRSVCSVWPPTGLRFPCRRDALLGGSCWRSWRRQFGVVFVVVAVGDEVVVLVGDEVVKWQWGVDVATFGFGVVEVVR
jgi:hypothetical protein